MGGQGGLVPLSGRHGLADFVQPSVRFVEACAQKPLELGPGKPHVVLGLLRSEEAQLRRRRVGRRGGRRGRGPGRFPAQGVQGGFQGAVVDGFGHETIHAGFQALLAHVFHGVGGDGDDGHGRVQDRRPQGRAGPDGAGGLDAVDLRHLDVHEHGVEAFLSQIGVSLPGGFGHGEVMAHAAHVQSGDGGV